MSFFGSLFRVKNCPIVGTDEIYPLNFLDNLAACRDSVLSETLRFNHVLDANKLYNGLSRLIQHGGWRKLGGRLRTRSDGSLELHVPKEFTDDRPPVQFTTKVFDVAIEEHQLGSQLPKTTDSPSLQPGPRAFDSFNPIPNMPDTVHEYIYSDRPVLGLHVTSFTNSTVVTLSWPHVVAGGLGVKEIISAWSKALRTDGDMPALLGARKDVLDGIGTEMDNPPPYSLGPREIKGWGFVKLALRLLWSVVRRPEVQSRTLCLPRQFVSRLKEAALRDLNAAHQGDNAPFISENDVLEAWASRFVAQARGGQRSALVVTSLDIKSRLNAPWGTGGVYVQNTAGCVYTSVDANVLLRRPLGELAHVFRQSMQESATDEQIRAQLRIFRTLGHKKRIPLYGDPDSYLMSFSNWTKFDIFDAADFSPAVLSTPSAGSGTPIGKPVYVHCQALGENRLLRDCFNITGKDWEGNCWITAFLYPEDWTKLEEYMEQTCQRLRGPKMSGEFSPAGSTETS